MKLYHTSMLSIPVGTHLLPTDFMGKDRRPPKVFFWEEKDMALSYLTERFQGAVYEVDSEDITELRPVRLLVWETQHPVLWTSLHRVTSKDGYEPVGLRKYLEDKINKGM